MPTDSSTRLASPHRVQELDRLGDAIAELAAHLDAATARLLDELISLLNHVGVGLVDDLLATVRRSQYRRRRRLR